MLTSYSFVRIVKMMIVIVLSSVIVSISRSMPLQTLHMTLIETRVHYLH